MSIRAQQVGSIIMRTVSTAVRALNDPRLDGVLVVVLQVQVPPDLNEAVVSVSVTPAEHGRRALVALDHARGHLQAQVGRAARMRTIPRLRFRLDESLKRQDAIFDAIQEGLASEAASDQEANPHMEGTAIESPGPGQEPRR